MNLGLIGGQAKHGAIVTCSSRGGRAIKVPVVSKDQRSLRLETVTVVESMQDGQGVAGSEFENCSRVIRSAEGRGSVKGTIGAFDKRIVGIRSMREIECVDSVKDPRRRDCINGAVSSAAARVGGPVEGSVADAK